MERDLSCWSTSNPEDAVFENLQWTRVEIKLKDSDRQKAIDLIEDHIKEIEDKEYILYLIAFAIERELFKSKEIDVETIKKLASFYPRCVEVDDDPKDDRWMSMEYDNFKPSPDDDEDESDGDGGGGGGEEEEEEEEGEEKAVADDRDDPLKEREAVMKALRKYENAGMKELKRQSNIIGCSLKQGKEQEIFSAMISFFADQGFVFNDEFDMESFVRDFMSRVRGYISSTCKLEDVETVRKALDVAKQMMIEADAPQVDQQLEMNTVPTNEEGIASPAKRLKQENRDCGIVCENAIPFNQTEQEEICLTPREFEGMKTEECEIATCYEPARQGEGNAVDVNFRLTPIMNEIEGFETMMLVLGKTPFSPMLLAIAEDLDLKDKIIVYDLAKQRIGWAQYDCSMSVSVSSNTSTGTASVNGGSIDVNINSNNSLKNDPFKLLPISMMIAFLVHLYNNH